MERLCKDMLHTALIYMFAGALLTFQGATSHAAEPWAVSAGTDGVITVLFFGDSLTAAYGLAPEQGFSARIRDKVSGAPIRVVTAGVSGETTAGGVRRIGWLLKRRIDVMVLALGGNDGLRGIDPESMRANLQAIIDRARRVYPRVEVIVAGMEAPPNMGTQYTNRFRGVFTDVAAANSALLIPFLLEGVAAVPELNLPDGIHPNAEGHQIVADHVWEVLGPLLKSMLSRRLEKGDDSQILENRKQEEEKEHGGQKNHQSQSLVTDHSHGTRYDTLLH